MLNELKQSTQQKMNKSLESLHDNLKHIRTGRAQPALISDIMVDAYGQPTPLSHVANITVIDAFTLGVSPWDKGMVIAIERAIRSSDLGLNPAAAGAQQILVPLPPLNEERRKELVKKVKAEAENSKIAIRNIRRDAMQHLKDMQKNKQISEDDVRRGEDIVQKVTDEFIGKIDKAISVKESELMEI